MRELFPGGLFILPLLFLAACSGSDNPAQAAPSVVEISIVNNQFEPAEVTVPAGTTVRWTNDDPVCLCGDFHKVQSGSPGHPTRMFDMMFMEMDATGEYTFSEKGTFPYFCASHGETGVVTVQ